MCDPSWMVTCKVVMDQSLEGKWWSAILTLQNYTYADMGLMLILLEKFILCAFLTGITVVGKWKDLENNSSC